MFLERRENAMGTVADDLILYTGNHEVDSILDSLAEDIERMRLQGFVECKKCGARFRGKDLGEMLEKLGRHGERIPHE